MYTLPIRIVLLISSLALGAYFFPTRAPLAYILFGVSAYLVIGYFRHGAIRPAFFSMRRGEFQKADRQLSTILFPATLASQSKAYYHWTHAEIIANTRGDFGQAIDELNLAIGGDLRTSNDRAIAKATLAQYFLKTGDQSRALELITEAIDAPHREENDALFADIKSQIELDHQ